MNNIVLCGFMGCGKTTVGKALAGLLHHRFVDMDAVIEQNCGMRVSEMFEKKGEAFFRAREAETARKLSRRHGLVLSTGGGAVLQPENCKVFRSGGKIVLIEVPLSVISLRLAGDRSRPLLQREDREEAMRALYEARMPVYRSAADIIVYNETNAPALWVAQEIRRKLADAAAVGKPGKGKELL